ncbi:MAG TPA: histidine kinase [Thermoanaerobaculia bacterium]|nr:histidine kinase [Thermoanaerobaculia bacterium]
MTTRLTPREHLLIFAFWTGLALVSAVNRLLDAPGFIRVMSPAGPVVLAFVEAWIWAGFTPFIFKLSGRYSLERSRLWVSVPMLIAAGVVISIIVYLVIDGARELIIVAPRPRRHVSTLREIARFRFVNQFIFYFAVLATGFAREYFLRDRERESQQVRLQAQLAEARLSALRMQLNPHFLFNTLHAMSALVERDPSGVRKMIARLSDLLRHTTDSSARNEIPLREELDFLRRYIDIMEIRFQGRLRATIDVDDAVLDAQVPNLILQPIVENALEHGVSRVQGTGEIAIRGTREDDGIVLTVRDNGPGVAADERAGVGLSNTRARLAQLYGDRARIELTANPEGGALARIVIPDSRADRR